MKRILALIMVLGLMIPFAGCGNTNQGSDNSSGDQTTSSNTSTEKKDGEVETVGNDVIRYYNSEKAYGKAVWTFDEKEKITSLTLELTSKNGSSLEQAKKDHLDGGFEVVESTDTTLKMKAGKKLLENERVKHTSKQDLITTLESQENQ